MVRHVFARLAGLALGLALPGAALAASGPQCTLPAVTPAPHPYGPSEHDPQRIVDSSVYTITVSWAPQY